MFLSQHSTLTQSRQKWTGFPGLQVGLGSTPCQTRKENGSWFILAGHRRFEQAVAQTLAAVKCTMTRRGYIPHAHRETAGLFPPSPRVYSVLK